MSNMTQGDRKNSSSLYFMSTTNSFYGDSFRQNKDQIAKDFISETTEVHQMIYLIQ
jgi:hypothetical protein